MKTRIISAGIGIALLSVVLLSRQPVVINICISIVNLVALIEILFVTKYVTYRPMLLVGGAYALLVPFIYSGYVVFDINTINVLYVILLFAVTLLNPKEVTPQQVAFTFTMSMLLTYAFSSFLLILAKQHGLFYFILACNCAWVTDAGAYFIGSFFGKHKMAPEISPKKTIEGAVGGVVTSLIAAVIISLIYQYTVLESGAVDLVTVLVVTPVFSVAGMMGDLIASYIKRSCNLKDYGNIMPGHGGVLDRFDSLLVTVPLFYVLLNFIPIIKG